jgi:membrane associated rhomboid family serine protease
VDRIEMDRPGGPWEDRREPLFNAPWTIVALCLGLIALYVAQVWLVSDTLLTQLALTPAAIAEGRWQTLLTSLFLHGSWTHVLMNSVAALAFGPPTARLMGQGPRGALVFFGFYLACGAVAGLGYILVDPHNQMPVVGASGAISGLLGAASRLIQGRGRIGSVFGSTVIGMFAAWTIVNVILGVSGLTPGAAGMPVAWQAHIIGYLAGVALVGPFARLAGVGGEAFTQ